MDKALLIRGGRVLAETMILDPGYVLVVGGRIASLGLDADVDAAWLATCEPIDARGLLVCPGLIDMHTHGILDVDFMESDHDATLRALSEYAAHGVTRVVASTLANPMEIIIAQVKQLGDAMEDRSFGQILLGVHIEGPWLAPRCRGGHALEYLKNPNKAEVERLLGETGSAIRSVTFAPELPGSVALVEALSRAGILASIGHSEASYEEAERAILAGARHATHLYDTNLGYREDPDEALVMLPGHETAILLHDEVSVELIGCPAHVRKPFFRFIDKVKPRDKKVIVTDSLVGTGMPEGTILAYKDGRRVYKEEGVLRMIDEDPRVNGNLTGSAVTLEVALRRLGEYAGLPPEEALRWGSINPATTLGIQAETGSLAVGKWADIVLMDEAYGVSRTFVKGMPLYSAKAGSAPR
jgi:N-acetylglucosamine-6-phosphate deacetylase